MKTTLLVPAFFLISFFANAQDVDSTVIKQVDSLIQVSRDLTGKGEYDTALEVNTAAEKIALEKLGRESAAYGSCCYSRGRVLYYKKDFSGVEKWCLESKAIREKVLGKEHPDYAKSLNGLVFLYLNTGQHEKAESQLLEQKAILEKTIGKEHPDYASNLNALARLYDDMGKQKIAEPLYLESKAIREKVLGKEHPDYATSADDLGALYYMMGQYEKAEGLYLEAKAIRKKVLGQKHPIYAASLNNLAVLYMKTNQYEKAEGLLLESKAILEITLGKEHLDYAKNLNNLGFCYQQMSQYEKAEPFYLQSLSIKEKLLGKEHQDCFASLNNLAAIYTVMGQYEKAEGLIIKSNAIWEKAMGKENTKHAMNLNDLGYLYYKMGQYKKAEALYLESKTILEKILGNEHTDYAHILNHLGILYFDMGNFEKAEPLYLESKAIREKALGKEHFEYAGSIINLGNFYRAMGAYEKAEALYLEGKTIFERSNSLNHRFYVIGVRNLALLYWNKGQYEKATPYFLELSSINNNLIEKSMYHFSERELNEYLKLFSESQDNILGFTQIAGKEELIATCYDNSLFYKGFLLNTVNQIKGLARSDSATAEQFNLLKSYELRLAAQYAKPISERDSAGVVELEEKANNLEKDLARTVAGFGEAQRQVKWQEVQACLKPGEAAVEFVHYRLNDSKSSDSTMYTALVLHPGLKQPAFIPLFEEKSLDSLLQTRGERKADYVNGLYTVAERGATPLGKPQKTLYEMLWQPMGKDLAGIKTIYFSPSGLLHRLNLAAIPINLDSVLGDRYNLVELGSTRQLVVPTQVKPAANDALLFGGISYDSDSTAMSQANAALDSVSIASRGELSFSYTDSTLRVFTWNALPFTEREVGSVEKTLNAAGFQTSTRKGYAATEEIFKTIGAGGSPSPRVLHLATHGYFFPDPKSAGERASGEQVSGEPVFKLSDHPMIRSGLLLAGGNHAWQRGKPIKEGMEDGILTAYEISQMNLSNTELVVLSACETGLGDISGNEGVYGLQRAFKIAGAKYLIMSLWQVPDKQTSLLMTTFYKKWLEEKMAIPEAFRAAQKELREAGLDPYQWAGFVLVE